nr:integrase, catalytic region, zinc finger, CCHC-type, peptidase aspartic, catalytic [Tanacetum cinerariifolium]
MANLLEDIQCVGSDTRPPMLDRTEFASWQQRIRLYCRGKENGVNIMKSIDEGPFQMGIFGEILTDETEEGSHLCPERPRVYSDLSLKKRIAVKLNRGLRDSNYDQLYAYLKQQEAHANENKMMFDRFTQHIVDPLALMNQATVQDGKVVVQNVQGRLNRGQGNNPQGGGAAGYGGAQNRVRNANPDDCDAFDFDVDEAHTTQTMFMQNLSSANLVYDEAGPLYDSNILTKVHDHDHYEDAICEHHEEHEMHDNVQPNHVVDSHADYTSDSNMIPYDQYVKDNAVPEEVTSLKKEFKQKENKYLEEFLDMKSLKENVEDKLYKQDQSLQTVHMLCKPKPYYNELNKVAIGYKNPSCLTRAKQVQPALYNGHEIIKNNHVPTIVRNIQDTLKIAEITRRKMNDKMKDPECVKHKVKIAPHDYSKENFLATFTPQKQLTPEQIFWSQDLIKMKAEALKEQTTASRPIKALTVKNTEVHLDYLRHLKESVETLREIVKEAKVVRPLDSSIVFACRYTKHSQELLEYVIGTCPQDYHQRDKKHAPTPLIRKKQVTFEEQCDTSNSNTHKHVAKLNSQKTNVHVPPSTGVNRCTDASGSQSRSNTKKNRISPAKGVNKMKVEEHPVTNKSHLSTTNRVDSSSRYKHTVVQIILWYLDSCCSKHMTGDHSRLMNFMKKFIGTVRFRNDHFGAIIGYGDYVICDSVISTVYYVEGLGYNLFFVEQFCDSDLEVAFRKHSCYVRDTNGVELIKGSRGFNLYTISVADMMKSFPICLLSKASKNKSWLWH